MSNGSEACCALGICCPPASLERVEALTKIIADNTESDRKLKPEDAAACVLEHFDLAPKGSLDLLVSTIAKMARKHSDV